MCSSDLARYDCHTCTHGTVLLLLVPLQKLNMDGAVRARVAIITGLVVLGYIVTVYLIFFLTYTPVTIDHVRGVQGRYFVMALPLAAIFLASLINVGLPRSVLAATAITGSLLSGITSFQSLLAHIGKCRTGVGCTPKLSSDEILERVIGELNLEPRRYSA